MRHCSYVPNNVFWKRLVLKILMSRRGRWSLQVGWGWGSSTRIFLEGPATMEKKLADNLTYLQKTVQPWETWVKLCRGLTWCSLERLECQISSFSWFLGFSLHACELQDSAAFYGSYFDCRCVFLAFRALDSLSPLLNYRNNIAKLMAFPPPTLSRSSHGPSTTARCTGHRGVFGVSGTGKQIEFQWATGKITWFFTVIILPSSIGIMINHWS